MRSNAAGHPALACGLGRRARGDPGRREGARGRAAGRAPMVSSPLTAIDFAAVAVMLLLIRLSRHAGMWIYALVALPGTALHEFSHYLVALVLGGSPSFP